ncbi:MAG: excinuclease ABC subunit UvrC [Theionarchaea archaeon]|nr:excinuclease ABC subunit UvrC [Theionarchaea archaeon]MBU7038115.1 excinuclease ABC subunit UvrC [Theionarchaea archaeon]
MDYPDRPGVYLMKEKDTVIYIGKAKSLKNRLTMYSQKNPDTRTQDIVAHTTATEFIVCENEVDALLLEANLIKEYKPRFNIRLKDDTMYPYLKVTNEEFPRVMVTRDVTDGKVFGPFQSAKALRKTMKFMRRLFPLKTCKTHKKRECLEYHLGLCPAPCTNKITREEYAQNVKRLIMFLEGRIDDLTAELEIEMQHASQELDFEKAALIRDRISALEKSRLTQYINHPFLGDIDVIAVRGEKTKCFTVMVMRKGRIIGKHQYVLESDIEEFLSEFYASRLVPDEIVLQTGLDPAFVDFLERKRGKRVRILTPKRGKRKRLLRMVEKDAEIHLKYVYGELELLRDELGLSKVPERIEGYDVSNIMGQEATASQVCFLNGNPSKKDYRHYKIQVPGIDDYAMIEEVLQRRFKDTTVLPDLLLIDGGKGHLSVALRTLRDLGLDIPVVALAKKEEEVFTPQGKVSQVSKKLLIKVRDEAHRFAITYHKTLRRKKMKRSILDDIKGIGEKRKKMLMKHFGSVENMRTSSVEELQAVLRNRNMALRVHEFLKDTSGS